MPYFYGRKKKHGKGEKKTKDVTTTSQTNEVVAGDQSITPAVSNPNLQEPAADVVIGKENSSTEVYKIEMSEIMGRYLVAARQIAPGGFIIRNTVPLVVAPCADSDPVCLGCYRPIPIDREDQYKCPSCAWGLCSSTCPGLKTINGHSSWECSLLRKKRVADLLDSSCESDIRLMYECIAPLRCLLLKITDLHRYELLMTMEPHNTIRRDIPLLWERNQHAIVDRIRDEWGIVEFDEDEIHTACGMLEVNCFEIGQNGGRARALYPNAFLLAHDCTPNTTHTDNPKNHSLTIRATRKIAAGEAITLSYAYTLQGTLKRRDHLKESKFFWCECPRCKDPTELGTYSSAMQCPKCVGFVMSTDPLDQNAQWKCQACSYPITGACMRMLVDRIDDEMQAIEVTDVIGFETFLKKYQNVLHKNHFLCISAKHSLSSLYGRSEDYIIHTLTDDELRLKESYCRDVIEVVDILEAGLSRLRGTMMYELHAPIMLLATRDYENKRIPVSDLKKRLKEVVHLLEQSYLILSMEPEGSGEMDMAIAARDALKKIGKF